MAANNNTIERLADLVYTLLNAGHGLTLDEITTQLPNYPKGSDGASRQQFERDKALLRRDGIEVIVIADGSPGDYRYKIDPDTYFLPEMDLTSSEVAALDFAFAAVGISGVTDVDGLAKIGVNTDSPSSTIVDIEVSPAMPQLYQAITMQAETRFTYGDKKRKLSPISLTFNLGHWYLTAYDPEAGQEKRFRVDRIEGEISNGPKGSGVAPTGARGAGDLPSVPSAADDAEAEEVLVLEVLGASAWRLERELGSTYVTERLDSGGVVFSIPIRSWAQARPWVLGLLDQAVVRSPTAARSSMVEWLESVAAMGPVSAPSVTDASLLSPPSSDVGPDAPTSTPTQRRLQRLFAMLEWLAEVGTADTSDVADRFGMTVPEVVSELEFAACCGRPPFSPGELINVIVDAHTVSASLPELERARRFSAAEAMVLITAAKTLLAIPGREPGGALASALTKVEEALGGAQAIEIEIDQPEHLSTLQSACETRRELEVVYLADNAEVPSERTIDPINCEVIKGQWYVWAWCQTRQDVRIFRADRFQTVADVGPQPDDLDRSLADGHRLVSSDDAEIALIVLEPSARWVADSIPIVGRHDEKDGRIVISVAVLSTIWFGRLLLQAGTAASVLSPDSLTTCAQETATRVLGRYQPTV